VTTPATTYSHVFGSPLMIHRWADGPALNAQLLPAILAERERSPGVVKTNKGGWHSDYGHLEFCGEAGATLVAHMRQLCERATAQVFQENGYQPKPVEWTLHAWANVNDTDDFNQVHTHPGSTWSGTYYVDHGAEGDDPADQAPIQFYDPCQGRANTFFKDIIATSFTWRPQPGSMILFPSYLAHMVLPHKGPRPRVSIAFNFRREPFP
jgi:uncharacterized protein (TIGR02466 family)